MDKKEKGFVFNQEAVKYLSDLLKESDLNEVEYKCGEISIKFSKNNQQFAQPIQAAPVMRNNLNEVALAQEGTKEAPKVEVSNDISIKSPMVGRAYLSPKPGAEPFCKVGSKVEKGDVIMIIEAMKVMNNIQAKESGTIKEILVKDGDAIEFDQVLVKLS